ncbi:MAG: hypothetical protein WA908_07385 [Pontixanthobacter sp.]
MFIGQAKKKHIELQGIFMIIRTAMMSAAAASLATIPIAANAQIAERSVAPIGTASQLGDGETGEEIGAAVIILAIAAAGMAVLLLTDDDDDEDLPESP